MQIENPTNYVSQIRQQAEGKDFFFVTNCSLDKRTTIHASFPESKGTACLWDTETGERFRYPSISNNILSIDLPPATSQLIVFDIAEKVQDYPSKPVEIAGKELEHWSVRMEHLNGTTQEKDLSVLCDFSADESTRSFAGYLYYEKQLDGNTSQYNWIDLGRVCGVSEVSLNGEELGCRWYGRHLYRIPEHLAKADKTIRVKITTTVGNYLKSMPYNTIGFRETKHQNFQTIGLLGPVKLM
jgi:hypothetical protein